MRYSFSKTVGYDFDTAITKVSEALKNEGFGILTEIDIKDTLKKKLDVDFRRYSILGACNPTFAYKALQYEKEIGTMLPCNVVVQEIENEEVKISIIDPVKLMMAVENEALAKVAHEVSLKLKNVIQQL